MSKKDVTEKKTPAKAKSKTKKMEELVQGVSEFFLEFLREQMEAKKPSLERAVKYFEKEETQTKLTELIKGLVPKPPRVRKPKKDPDAPKGVRGPYIFFCDDARKKVIAENPHMIQTEVAKKMGEMWKKLTESEKAPYIKAAQKDKKRHEREMSLYVPKPGWEKAAETKKEKKDPNAPKGPPNTYMLFCADHRDTLKKENPKMNGREINKLLSEMWKEVGSDEKEEYENIYKKRKAKSDKEKKAYEEKKSSEEKKESPKKEEEENDEEESEEEEEKVEKKSSPKKKPVVVKSIKEAPPEEEDDDDDSTDEEED